MTSTAYHGERPISRADLAAVAELLGYHPDRVTTLTVDAYRVTVTESDGRSSTTHTHPVEPWLPGRGDDEAEPITTTADLDDEVETRARAGAKPW